MGCRNLERPPAVDGLGKPVDVCKCKKGKFLADGAPGDALWAGPLCGWNLRVMK